MRVGTRRCSGKEEDGRIAGVEEGEPITGRLTTASELTLDMDDKRA